MSPHIATLLPACREVESAANELRWIRDHIDRSPSCQGRRRRLDVLCRLRARGVPLQYILGSQPFGELEIICKPGVLVPRAETEAYTCYLASLVRSGELLGRRPHSGESQLRIVDFCTGTGCIPSLLFASLSRLAEALEICGVDVSVKAVQLAKASVVYNTRKGFLPRPGPKQTLTFIEGDIFKNEDLDALFEKKWDIIVANPPYISRDVWDYGRGQIGWSVRKYEPQLALVPADSLPLFQGWRREDTFYARLLELGAVLRPRAMLLEVGDEEQARRLLETFFQTEHARLWHAELWRNSPDLEPKACEVDQFRIHVQGAEARAVKVKGSGCIRSILLRKAVKSVPVV